MKRATALAFLALFIAAAFAACGGGPSGPTGATYLPYDPNPSEGDNTRTRPYLTTAVQTTRDFDRIPIGSNYPETVEISFVREGTTITMSAIRQSSALGYVIYQPEEYDFEFIPGPTDRFMPDPDKYSTANFSLWITEIEPGAFVPPKTTTDGRCSEYRHVQVGERMFQLRMNYNADEAATVRPLLVAMMETITI